jgi:hypothetical protein
MTDRNQIDAFNQHLDVLLGGGEPDLSTLPEDDRQAIYLASCLADLDLSAQSAQRYSLRRNLLLDGRVRPNPSPGLARRLSFHSSPTLLIAFPSATLLLILVFVLGWSFTNLGRLPASSDPVSATAFAIPGTMVESGLPPKAENHAVQSFAPQPLPTPIAPTHFIEYTPSTVGPERTPPLNSRQVNPVGVTRSGP